MFLLDHAHCRQAGIMSRDVESAAASPPLVRVDLTNLSMSVACAGADAAAGPGAGADRAPACAHGAAELGRPGRRRRRIRTVARDNAAERRRRCQQQRRRECAGAGGSCRAAGGRCSRSYHLSRSRAPAEQHQGEAHKPAPWSHRYPGSVPRLSLLGRECCLATNTAIARPHS